MLLSGVSWGQARGRFGTGLIGCAALRFRRDPGAPRCFADLGGDLARPSHTLATELARLVSQLHGGCQDLARVALKGDAQLGDDLERARRAGESGPLPAFVRAFVQLRADHDDADLQGAVGRFLLLCSSR